MLFVKQNLGLGSRSSCYYMVVNDGIIEQIFIELGYENSCESDPFEVSDEDTLLGWLLSRDGPNKNPGRSMFFG